MKRNILIILAFSPLFLQGQNYKTVAGHLNGVGWTYQGLKLSYTMPLYNANASALFERMPIQLSEDYKDILSQEFDSLQYYGTFDRLDYFNYTGLPYAQQSTFNWVNNSHTLNIFNNPEFIPNRGFKFNGIDKYINLNYNPFTDGVNYTLNSAQYGIFSLDNFQDNGYDMGMRSASASSNLRIRAISSNSLNPRINDATFNTAYVALSSRGLFVINRKASSSYIVVVDGDSVASRPNASVAIPDNDAYIGAYNNLGVATSYTTRTYSHAHFAGSLTNLQNQKLYESIERLNTYSAQFDTSGYFRDIYYSDPFVYKKAYSERIKDIRILSSKDNLKFGFGNDTIYYTVNGGNSYPYKLEFVDDLLLTVAFCFEDGNIYFATKDNIAYASYDSLQTIEEITLLDSDGSAYVFHTPVNASFPGSYYNLVNRASYFYDRDGKEIFTYGNYGNTDNGANPTLIYTCYVDPVEDTLIFKVNYEFGQNPNFTDDGTATGGVGGNLLGNPNNFIITRHVHEQAVNPEDSTIIFMLGDAASERGWVHGVYNVSEDTLAVSRFVDSLVGVNNPRFRSLGFVYYGDSIIFGSDDGTPGQIGFWKADLSDIDNVSGHRSLYEPVSNVAYSMVNFGDTVLVAMQQHDTLLYSVDKGNNWNNVLLPDLTTNDYTYSRMQQPDNKGYAVVQTAEGSYYIKPENTEIDF